VIHPPKLHDVSSADLEHLPDFNCVWMNTLRRAVLKTREFTGEPSRVDVNDLLGRQSFSRPPRKLEIGAPILNENCRDRRDLPVAKDQHLVASFLPP